MAHAHDSLIDAEIADDSAVSVFRQVAAELAGLVYAVNRLQLCIDRACVGQPVDEGEMIRELQAFDLVAQTLDNLSTFMDALEPADIQFENLEETIKRVTLKELAIRLRADRVVSPQPPSGDPGDVDLF